MIKIRNKVNKQNKQKKSNFAYILLTDGEASK